MRFLVRKRRQPPAIIIVALIDILIVLLIFLMVTTAFKQQPALKLSLPQSSQARATGAQENPPLVVTIDKEGGLRLGQEGRPVTPDQLSTNLAAEVLKNPELKVAIAADEAAPWGRVLKVMDAVKGAGIQGVNAFSREPAKAAP
jgi:biopolymer transport protein ExbD